MSIPAGQPSWTDLMTPNATQAQAFYTELFGWQYWQSGEEYGHYAMAHQNGNSVAGIYPSAPGATQPSTWTVYFASDDIKTDARRIRELGGQVIMEPMQVGDQGHMGLFTDPTGATFGLWQAGNHKGAQVTDQHGSVIWVEVNTRDSECALGFYTQLFKADSSPVPGIDYHQLKHGDSGYAGVSGMGENWEAITPAHWVTYFYVTDVDAAARTAGEQGGRVLVEPFDMTYGRMAVLADPAGATFCVMNPQPAGS